MRISRLSPRSARRVAIVQYGILCDRFAESVVLADGDLPVGLAVAMIDCLPSDAEAERAQSRARAARLRLRLRPRAPVATRLMLQR